MTESFFTLFFILVSAAGAGINGLAGLLAGGLSFLHCIGMSQCRFSLFRLGMSADRAGVCHLAGLCAGRLRGRSAVILMISLRDLLIIGIPAYSTGKCLDPCLFAGGFPCDHRFVIMSVCAGVTDFHVHCNPVPCIICCHCTHRQHPDQHCH